MAIGGPKMAPDWPQDGAKMAPKRFQDGSKSKPKPSKNQVKIYICFVPVYIGSNIAPESPRWVSEAIYGAGWDGNGGRKGVRPTRGRPRKPQQNENWFENGPK